MAPVAVRVAPVRHPSSVRRLPPVFGSECACVMQMGFPQQSPQTHAQTSRHPPATVSCGPLARRPPRTDAQAPVRRSGLAARRLPHVRPLFCLSYSLRHPDLE